LKLLQCFISHVTASETEIQLFRPLKVPKLFQNYFSDIERDGNYSRAAIKLGNNFEIISDTLRMLK